MENQMWNRLRSSKDRSPSKDIVIPSAYDSVDDEDYRGKVQFTPPLPATAYESVDEENAAFKYSSPLARSRAPLSSGQDILLKFSQGFEKQDVPEEDDPGDDKNCWWNSSFQKALDNVRSINPLMSYAEREEVWHKLASISKDFAYCAKSYGRIIISEHGLPSSEKQIKPVDLEQGHAGGEKFIVNSIIFKFAIDNKNVFAGDEDAPWTFAGQDLLCLNTYSHLVVSCKINSNISFPLCCLVDYRGYRIVAVSLIPRTSNSLLYGSADSGQTIANNVLATTMMDEVGKQLNLEKHWVCCRNMSNQLHAEQLSCCADLELHSGADSRYYLIDFARAMPPQDPQIFPAAHKCGHLTNKLRPEFVLSYNKPLNPDACSKFIQFAGVKENSVLTSRERDIYNEVQKQFDESKREIQLATRMLLQDTIPSLAKKLCDIIKGLENPTTKKIFCEHWTTVFIHFYGVNIRWIGAIRNSIEDNDWKTYLLIEAIARAIKKKLNRRLRHKIKELGRKPVGERPFIQVVIDYLNKIFGTKKSKWPSIELLVEQKFPTIFDQEKEERENRTWYVYNLIANFVDPSDKLRERRGLNILFDRICDLFGLHFRAPIKKLFSHQYTRFTAKIPFDITDIISLDEVIKCNHIIAYSQGTVLRMRAQSNEQAEGKNEYTESLYQESLVEFQHSLRAVPRAPQTLSAVGDVYTHLNVPSLAVLFYKTAIEADEADPGAHFRLAQFLHRSYEQGKAANEETAAASLREIEHYFERAYKLEKSTYTMIPYANFLNKITKHDEAAAVFAEAVKLFESNPIVHSEYAAFLADRQQIIEADEHHKQAIELSGSKDIEIIEKYVVFLREKLCDEAQANIVESTLGKLKLKTLGRNLKESVKFTL